MAVPAQNMALALDPYLEWAGLTRFKYLAYRRRNSLVFAAHVPDKAALAAVTGIRGLSLRTTPASFDASKSLFFSIELRNPTRQSLNALRKCSNFVLAEPGMRAVHESRDVPATRNFVDDVPQHPRPCRQDVVFAVIDGRCGFANGRFCDRDDPRSSLIDYFWDQGADVQPRWGRPAGASYGRELSRKEINAALSDFISASSARHPITRAAAETDLYRALGHSMPEDCDWSHGTHVLDTIITDFASTTQWQRTGRDRPGVIYVQLPDAALRDTSGRWMAANVLDALHYILRRTRESSQVVVNLSLGSFGGPHDGSSVLERAIDALVSTRHGRLAVVVAAGNARKVEDDSTGAFKSCHSSYELAPKRKGCDNKVELELELDSQDSTETFLELWLRSASAGYRPVVGVSLQRPRLAATSPEPPPPDEVMPGFALTHTEEGEVVGAVINNSGHSHAPNGAAAMVLVAIGSSRNARGGTRAQTGRWKIVVTNHEGTPVFVDAWIERRDIPGELVGERPQYGFSENTRGISTLNSLGSIANGKHTVVVGAVDRDENGDYRRSEYSSVGPPGKSSTKIPPIPIIFAEGEREAAGFLSGSRTTLRGTSMASAQVTAALGASSASRPKGSEEGGLPDLIKRVQEQAEYRKRQTRVHGGKFLDAGTASAFVLPSIPSKHDQD